MACYLHSSVFPQPPRNSAASSQARAAHCRGSGGVASRRDAPLGGGGSWSAASTRPPAGLQATLHVSTHGRQQAGTVAVGAAATAIASGMARNQSTGRFLPTPVPDVDAAQLLRSLGLDGIAQPAAVLASMRKLPGVRQQGVLDTAAAVAAHLLSPAVGLTRQQAGQLLERCPALFSWPPEQRAAVLFGELLGAGLTAAEAAACFAAFPKAAQITSLAPGLAELAAILAHSQDREGGSGRRAAVPAAHRTVAALLSQTPSAVRLGFGRPAAAAMVSINEGVLGCDPAVWQRNLCYMAACGVADPKALLRQQPLLVHFDQAAPGFVQRRLLLQRASGLTAAQLYEQPHCLTRLEPGELVQRLQFVEQRGQAHRLVAKATRGRKPAAASGEERRPALSLNAVTYGLDVFLLALGASQAEWEVWAAANPPDACPLYLWAQQAAGEEAVRLAAALPPELVQAERRRNPRFGRKHVAGK